MIKITKNDLETTIIGPKSVLVRDEYTFECHICRSCCRGVRCLDGFGLNTGASLDEENHHSARFSTTANSEIISKNTVSDPFLNEE